ncbi:MAG: hypothetical protein N3H30_00580 [Candidatus Micrarchaeota archaeon]|nr:hypothetical protein [Candidatus Micrarchaeota archaeon]
MKFAMRGQGSTEYLVLLAVALIVALVAIALLGWFPGVSGDTRESQSRSYWNGAQPFSVIEYKSSSTTGNLTLTLRNERSEKLTITGISVDGTALNLSSNISIKGGEEQTIEVALPAASQCDTAGDMFEYDLQFVYNTKTISGIVQTGARPLIGKCS